MESIYPAGPASVPEDLTRPSAAYRRHAWLAMGGLALFVSLYLALTGWFVWTAWRLGSSVVDGVAEPLWPVVGAFCTAFLGAFMLKALVFVKRTQSSPQDIEVTERDQPRLFAFLHRLADEAGAPRPHRVFLSGRVNAAVFYDLSIANLIFPSRKNLEIGLALVNVLTLGELKAVLAHEFGHFAQKAMAVGRWVYIAQQIAAHVISKRDALDRFLQRLSRIDIRIAWVGWGLSLIIWSIRSIMETVFRGVMLAQRALSREMELQADLVSVSLSGSDALVHALHKLSAADDAWERALSFAGAELQQQRRVTDVFALHTRVAEQLGRVLGDPDYGKAPALPEEQRDSHRLFKAQMAQPPRMWMTHPPSSEREDNCKRRYIHSPIDPRPAWEIFEDGAGLKTRLSAALLRDEKAEPATIEDSLRRFDELFERAYLNRAYRGAYLGRSVVRHAKSPNELYGVGPLPATLGCELEMLYPESLAADLEQLRNLEEQRAALDALKHGALKAPGGVIRHRGRDVKRGELPKIIEHVQEEIEQVIQRVRDHDRRCRTTHLAAAALLGRGWDEYLRGLVAILHYADHTEANILDARGYLANVFAIVTADGKISSSELTRLIKASDAVYAALSEAHNLRDQVVLDPPLTERLRIESWSADLPKLELTSANQSNIGSWMQVVDGWVSAYAQRLSALRLAALEQLLLTEAQIAHATREKTSFDDAPTPSRVPSRYTLLTPGMERERQTRLPWWDRFQLADGTLPTLARLAVAAAIVGTVFIVGGTVGHSIVTVYNGLGRAVNVRMGDSTVALQPFRSANLQLQPAARVRIEAKTAEGQLIESFVAEPRQGTSKYVYNIAGAGPLLEWVTIYGSANPPPPPRMLGAPRWTEAHSDYVFEEPPDSISGRGDRTRTVLASIGDAWPLQLLSQVEAEEDRAQLIALHARWDSSEARDTVYWLNLAAQHPNHVNIFATRLKDNPHDVAALRAEQNAAKGDQRGQVCGRHRALATQLPDNADLQYIAARCITDVTERDHAFIALNRKYPDNGWLAMAAGYAYAGQADWREAQRLFDQARRASPAVADGVAVELARVRRADTSGASIQDLIGSSYYVSYLNALETGGQIDGPLLAYHDLADGNLTFAIQRPFSVSSANARVVRLAAASDGSDARMVQQALALPANEGIDSDSVWAALALAIREHEDASVYAAKAQAYDREDAMIALRFIDAVRSHAQTTAAEQLLHGATPRMRGQAYSVALVLLGDRAPSQWRKLANRLLFSSERPYFREATPLPESTVSDQEPKPSRQQPDDGIRRTSPRFLGVES